jgi:predicted amidohydrolase YtcJ
MPRDAGDTVLIQRAEIDGASPIDVRIAGPRILELGAGLAARPGEPLLDAAGGALLPGLHDHHLHLFALAASLASVRCGPPAVRDAASLAKALAEASPAGEWIRGVGYHDSVAGPLDRRTLDRWVPARPLRVQHRSGALWMLNSAGVERLGLDRGVDAPGVERDAEGRASGRLFRLDGWLRERLEPAAPPGLGHVGRSLAAFGVTGVTDATPSNGPAELRALVAAVARGELRQHLRVMGSLELPEPDRAGVARGAVKLRLDENALPGFDELVAEIEHAHRSGRSVAFHCVTRAELVLALGALRAAGGRPGDRIEHAAVTPPEAMALLAELRLRVVVQPGFVRERGDAYRAEVDPADLPWLHRCRGFLEASVPLAGGTDAPFGDADPWRAMQAAVERRTEAGFVLGSAERLAPEAALALFTSPAAAPGDPPRRIAVGGAADLCLLDRPWARARERLSSECVAATICAGEPIWSRAGTGRAR